jgi:O-antigen ligase
MGSPGMALAITEHRGSSKAVAEQLLNFVLFITVLTSCLAFVEPSPHDALIFVLLTGCAAARVPFDRKLVPLVLLLLVWNVAGFPPLFQVADNEKAIQSAGTSLYLAIAGIMFACLFSTGNLQRLSIMRRAYILSALFATALGYVGFFHLIPGSDIFLTAFRVSATFKDPNVYGPFLIFPLVFLIISFLTSAIRVLDLAVMAFLLGGLLLSGSRGAWGHFVASVGVAFIILVMATREPRKRSRIVVLGAIAAIVTLLLVVALLSIPSVQDLILMRAQAIQPYDVQQGGRFWEQQIAPSVILDHPFGMAPFEFDRIYGLQTHNTYLQGFIVFGWLGGVAYLGLVFTTLLLGLRALLVPTAWQVYLVAAYATFVGEVGEGMIVDTGHWRHFFLLVGMIWGLSVASINFVRGRAGVFHATNANALHAPGALAGGQQA